MKSKDLVESIREEKSHELFDKSFNDLQISEIMSLNAYLQDLQNPTWKPILENGNETGYSVSNIGTVRYNGAPVKIYTTATPGYPTVYLKNLGNTQCVHRLMAEAFIPNPENKKQVNHINGKKTINWVGNLEWVTPKENAEHAWKIGLVNNRGENQGANIYSESTIENACRLMTRGFKNIEISKKTGIHPKMVSDIRMGKRWCHVSIEYKIPKRKRALYSNKKLHTACKMLEDPNISYGEVSEATGISVNSLKDIYKKSSYMRISNNYTIPPRNSVGEYGKRSKYTILEIEKVCKLLKEDQMTMNEISAETGVQLSSVYDIRDQRHWKSISSKYF